MTLLDKQAEKLAAESGAKLAKGLGAGKYLSYLALAAVASAQLLDISNGLEHKREAARMRAEQERRLKARDKRTYVPGLPGDPYTGIVQGMYEQRINHTRM